MIRANRSGEQWTLIGDGDDVQVGARFLRELVALGRSGYTQRSYALGLAAFLRWLAACELRLHQVTRRVIVRYVQSLGEGIRSPLSAASINHRLSVLSSFFAWRISLEEARDGGGQYANPVPAPPDRVVHAAPGREPPRRRRAELRRRVPIRAARSLDAETATRLIEQAPSLRDRAILTLLWRTGARIGDWLSAENRHGVLGLAMNDLNAKQRRAIIKLKGARDEHQVPVTDDFWALWADYVARERGGDGHWAWAGRRRGRGRALRYDAFAAMLAGLGTSLGVQVHAHMFRHGLAQAVTAVSGVHVTQQVLGHRHLSTTADFYARVDEVKVVAAVEEAARRALSPTPTYAAEWAFSYDPTTVEELERLVGAGGEGKDQ